MIVLTALNWNRQGVKSEYAFCVYLNVAIMNLRYFNEICVYGESSV